MYEYLIGVGILFLIWIGMFLYRADLRTPMLWGSLVYLGINVIMFVLMWISFKLGFIESLFSPNYWSPDTLFDLNNLTGGLSIEDALFMFFVGGVATAVYEEFIGGRIKLKKTYKPHFRALLIGYIMAGVFSLIINVNPIYPLILSGFFGATVLWIERRDLIKHSLVGGAIFLILYVVSFSIFNLIFSDFIDTAYNLREISGIFLLGIPIEEWLYALSFGLLWAPLYEYAHGEKVVEKK